MAFDERLAGRVRVILGRRRALSEKKMFGGVAFLLRGNMVCGVSRDHLMLRLGVEQGEAALEEPHTRPMEFTGRRMRGFVWVEPAGYASPVDLERWLDRAADFVESLPPKKKTPPKKKPPRKKAAKKATSKKRTSTSLQPGSPRVRKTKKRSP